MSPDLNNLSQVIGQHDEAIRAGQSQRASLFERVDLLEDRLARVETRLDIQTADKGRRHPALAFMAENWKALALVGAFVLTWAGILSGEDVRLLLGLGLSGGKGE